jgi:hypothetical protein
MQEQKRFYRCGCLLLRRSIGLLKLGQLYRQMHWQRWEATRKVVAERAAAVIIRQFAADVEATLERQLRAGRRMAGGYTRQSEAG